MTKRLKRHADFELSLQTNNESFINTPRKAQRSWPLNRAMSEFQHAAAHLREGGVFSYLSNELDSPGRQHQRQLFEHASATEIRCCRIRSCRLRCRTRVGRIPW